jgi:hypothetical protein
MYIYIIHVYIYIYIYTYIHTYICIYNVAMLYETDSAICSYPERNIIMYKHIYMCKEIHVHICIVKEILISITEYKYMNIFMYTFM